MVNRLRMEQQLLLHEGMILHEYKDTEGYVTLGVGYNVSVRGLSDWERVTGHPFTGKCTPEDALAVLDADITRVESAVRVHFPEYDTLSEVRQRVALDMAFNMGLAALGFHRVIAAVKVKDWSTAARELYKSRWARQVGDGEGGRFDRCDRLSKMLLTGQDYTA